MNRTALRIAVLTSVLIALGSGPARANTAPIAVAGGAPTAGNAPLAVAFSSAGSFDGDGDSLSHAWAFGDGAVSTAANPSHTYVCGAVYRAVLTVSDGQGGVASDTVEVVVHGFTVFPSTGILDDFNRPDSLVGGFWTGSMRGMVVSGNQVTTVCCDVLAVWDGAVFGPDQEAFVTFSSVQNQSQDLMLKVQGTTWDSGYIEVRYYAPTQQILLFTYDPTVGYVSRGAFSATFASGDQLGARAWANGVIQVFKNGTPIGSGCTGDWAFTAMGGRLGVIFDSYLPSRLDDFGGGDIVVNTPPTATGLAPPDGSFYVAGEPLTLIGVATDLQQPAGTLAYEWSVNLIRAGEVDPDVYVASGASTTFVPEFHPGGPDARYDVVLRVVDAGALDDTARATVYPEVDLEAGPILLVPGYPGTTTPGEYHFQLFNRGRMPSPPAHWRLMGGDVQLAEGDIVLGSLDSAFVHLTLPPLLAAGDYPMRLVVDTLGAVVETDESNNARVQTLTIVEGAGIVGVPDGRGPQALSLSGARPSPSAGPVAFALELTGPARVGLAVHDLLGRRMWTQPDRTYGAGRWTLGWDGRDASGAAAPTGIYHARVTVDGRVLVRTIARIR